MNDSCTTPHTPRSVPARSRVAEWKSVGALLVLVAFSMAVQGCAGPRAAGESGHNARSAARTASTDLLLAESLRQYINHRDPAQALAIAQLAVKRSPERPDALWILLQICGNAQGCQPEPLEAQLRTLDPTNGLVWLGPLNRSMQRSDFAAADQILEAIGRMQHVDLRWNSLVSKLAVALSERTRTTTPENKTPLLDGLNESVSLLSNLALPAFQPLSESCSSRRLVDKLVAARCLLVSAVLQRSDTNVAESVGLGIAQRLAGSDTVENAKVEQRIAIARYQREATSEIMSAQLEKERFAKELIEVMGKQRREQDVFIAIIRWAGQPLTPQPTG